MSDMATYLQSKMRICPKCETLNEEGNLQRTGYLCSECQSEIAYTDLNANGTIRGVFGYLKPVGEVINSRYRIRQLLGKGGFGSTYLVQDLRLQGKRRALKEVPQDLFDEQEVKLLSQLNHPSIPDITDRFSLDGFSYLVLEFGGTRTLGSECESSGGRIPFDVLLPWMKQLGDALIYLHSQEPPIIHRDLKPENILLDDHDHIMLIDFGIAKASSEAAGTRLLARAGSHGFSPPEQVLGTGTDERSDIYSFGATMYRLLTGKTPPPAHERVAGTTLEIPSTLVANLPAGLDEILISMMSLNLNQRPSCVRTIREAMTSLESASSSVVSDFSRTTLITPSISTAMASNGAASIPVVPGMSSGSRPILESASSGNPKRFPWIFIGMAALLSVIALAGVSVHLLSTPVPAPTPPATEESAPPAEPSVPRPKPASPIAGPKKEPSRVDLPKLDPQMQLDAPSDRVDISTDHGSSIAGGPSSSGGTPAPEPRPPLAVGPASGPAVRPDMESSTSGQAMETSAMDILNKRRAEQELTEPQPQPQPKKPLPKKTTSSVSKNNGWSSRVIE